MSKQELRIDDWVSYDGETYRVKIMLTECCTLRDHRGHAKPAVKYTQLRPIDITEAAFTRNNIGNRADKEHGISVNDLRLTFRRTPVISDTWFVYLHRDGKTVLLKSISYVHELQHLLTEMGFEQRIIA